MRRTVGVVVAVLLAAGCGWTQQDFDAGRSRGNTFETTLTLANASSLEHHAISGSVVAVVGPTIVTQQGVDVVAYDRATCPRADNAACTPVWTRADRQWGGSDGSRLVFDEGDGTTFEVTDTGRNLIWTGIGAGAATGEDGFVRLGRVAFTGDHLIVASEQYDGHGGTSEIVNVFPAAGCGTATCSPSRTFAHQAWDSWVASGDTLFLRDEFAQPLVARSMSSGAALWSTSEPFVAGGVTLRIRGGRVFVNRSAPNTGTAVYDLAGQQGCSGTPVVCSPVRVQTPAGASLLAISDQVGAGSTVTPGANGTVNRSLTLSAPDGAGCTSPCGPVATTAPFTTWANQGFLTVAVTANLVLTVGIPPGFTNRTFHLLAYDAHLASGCSGSPKVCQPVANVSFPGGNSAYADQPIVAGGRVYVTIPGVPGSDPITQVLSLPGDVG